jgi:HAD superfamily hydrolase (TIGR01549 family)
VQPTLTALAQAEIPLAICSNLAKRYGAVIDKRLQQFNFSKHFSYELGFIKSDKEIYDSIVNSNGMTPEQILFIGDTWLADYDGPTKYGFQAKHLVRAVQPAGSIISCLAVIL